MKQISASGSCFYWYQQLNFQFIKTNYDIFSDFLFANFSDIILTSLFPEQLKFSDIKPVFKKDFQNDERNYSP